MVSVVTENVINNRKFSGKKELRKQRRLSRRLDERANGLILLISTLPLVLSAFGLGLDMARNVWIRSTLQEALDSATVAASGVTRVGPGNRLIVDTSPARPENATQQLRKYYAINRPGFVLCRPNPGSVPFTNMSMCWVERPAGPGPQVGPRVSPDGQRITYSVRERSPNSGFLRFVNINFQNYNVTSQARIRE